MEVWQGQAKSYQYDQELRQCPLALWGACGKLPQLPLISPLVSSGWLVLFKISSLSLSLSLSVCVCVCVNFYFFKNRMLAGCKPELISILLKSSKSWTIILQSY